MTKTKKCKYCEYRFTPKEWRSDYENTMCFGCRSTTDFLRSIGVVFSTTQHMNAKCREFWQFKINNMLNG